MEKELTANLKFDFSIDGRPLCNSCVSKGNKGWIVRDAMYAERGAQMFEHKLLFAPLVSLCCMSYEAFRWIRPKVS